MPKAANEPTRAPTSAQSAPTPLRSVISRELISVEDDPRAIAEYAQALVSMSQDISEHDEALGKPVARMAVDIISLARQISKAHGRLWDAIKAGDVTDTGNGDDNLNVSARDPLRKIHHTAFDMEQPIRAISSYSCALSLIGLSAELDETPAGLAIAQIANDINERIEEIHGHWADVCAAAGEPPRGRDDDGNGDVEESASDVGGAP